MVRRERFGARGIHSPYIFPIQWGASWSYLEFPKHLIVGLCIFVGVHGFHSQPQRGVDDNLAWTLEELKMLGPGGPGFGRTQSGIPMMYKKSL